MQSKFKILENMIRKEVRKQMNEESNLETVDWSPLFKEINKRLGTKLNLKMDTTGKRPKIISPNIVNETGIFKNIFEKVSVDIFNFSSKNDEGSLWMWMTIDVYYTNKRGGSNGQQFLTAWLENGKWIFKD